MIEKGENLLGNTLIMYPPGMSTRWHSRKNNSVSSRCSITDRVAIRSAEFSLRGMDLDRSATAALAALSFNLVGDGLRDTLDPRLND